MKFKTSYIQVLLTPSEKALWIKGSKAMNYSTIASFVRKTIADFLESKGIVAEEV